MDAEQLYREHSKSLYRYITRLTGDSERAADIVQTTFMRLVEKPPRDTRVKSWLFRVATNAAIDHARSVKRHERLLEKLPTGATTGDGPVDPDVITSRKFNRLRVRAALERLPKRDQTVLLMRSEGFAHREIGEVIGAGTKSVGIIILRAMTRLSRQLGEER